MYAKPTILLSQSKLPADVEIFIFGQRYHLHSAVLRLFSGYFDGSLSETWWRSENTIPGPSPIKYRYGLSRDESGDLMLVPVGPDVALGEFLPSAPGMPPPPNTEDKAYLDRVDAETEMARSYDSLFRIIYHAPIVGYQTDSECECLLEVADLYCSRSVVATQIEHKLLSSPDIAQALAHRALEFLNLAVKVRSKKLFKDSFIHLVGRWAAYREVRDLDLPEGITQLAEDEYNRISGVIAVATNELQRLTVDSDEYSLAYRVIHRILRSSAKREDTREAVMYRHLSSPATWVMDREEEEIQAGLDARFPERAGGLQAFLARIPERLQSIVAPLLKNNLVLGKGLNFQHLTCAELRDDQYPWDNKELW